MPDSTYSLTDPSGKTRQITAEMAASYNQGANRLAPGFTITPPEVVSSDVLDQNVTREDATVERTRRETDQMASSDFAAYLNSQGTQQSDVLSRLLFPEANQELTAARANERTLLSQAGDYIKGIFGQDSVTRRENLAEEQGLAGAQSQLMESNKRLARLQGELQTIRPQIETEAGQTRIGAEARLNPVERNLRAEIASEALVQAALAGNVEMIQNNINTIMELEFADQDRDLKVFEARLKVEEQRIKGLEGEEADRADQRLQAAKVVLQDRSDAIAAARDEKSQQADLAVAYVEATGDGAGAVNIMNATSLGESMRMAGPFLKSGTEGEKPFIITSGALQIPATEIQQGAVALQNSVGNDSYANTELYTNMLGDWLSLAGLAEDFFEQFPPDLYLNPQDPTLPPQIKAMMRETENKLTPPSAYGSVQ